MYIFSLIFTIFLAFVNLSQAIDKAYNPCNNQWERIQEIQSTLSRTRHCLDWCPRLQAFCEKLFFSNTVYLNYVISTYLQTFNQIIDTGIGFPAGLVTIDGI